MRLILIVIFSLTGISVLHSQQTNSFSLQIQSKQSGAHIKFFKKFEKEIDARIQSLGSFIVWQNDSLVYEGYFHQATSQTSFNVKSITKTIVSALAGIAKDQALLPDLETPVLSILTEYENHVTKTMFGSHRKWHDMIP